MGPLLDYPAAAEALGLNEEWLRRRIKHLPHKKFGHEVRFTEADLARIVDMHHHEPASGPLATKTPAAAGVPAPHPPELAALRPLPSKRRGLRTVS